MQVVMVVAVEWQTCYHHRSVERVRNRQSVLHVGSGLQDLLVVVAARRQLPTLRSVGLGARWGEVHPVHELLKRGPRPHAQVDVKRVQGSEAAVEQWMMTICLPPMRVAQR